MKVDQCEGCNKSALETDLNYYVEDGKVNHTFCNECNEEYVKGQIKLF